MFPHIIHIVLTKLYVNEYNRKHTYTSYSYHPLLYMGDILLITYGDILLNPTLNGGTYYMVSYNLVSYVNQIYIITL